MTELPSEPAELYEWATTLTSPQIGDASTEIHDEFARGLLERTISEQRDQLDIAISNRLCFEPDQIDYTELRLSKPVLRMDRTFSAGYGEVVTGKLSGSYETPAQLDIAEQSPMPMPQQAPSFETGGTARVVLKADRTFTPMETVLDASVFVEAL